MNTLTITLVNPTESAIDASVVSCTDPRFTPGTAPGIIPAGESATLDINFTAGAVVGEHAGFLVIASGRVRIPLTARTLYILNEYSLDGLEVRLAEDATAIWFEVGFLSPFLLTGTAATGWTDPGGNLILRMERSEDLQTWDHEWTDAPGSPETIGSDYMYWARGLTPRLWKFVTVDITLVTPRAAKSITGLTLFNAAISLPNYPYAMPGSAATLQADLIAAGYTGATVTTVAAALTVEIRNNLNTGRQTFATTLSGSNVTDVKNGSGVTISLPGYPYAMPGSAATLRSALVTAGYPYASVHCYDDEWEIFLPNRDTIFTNREFTAAITPADPFTYNGIKGDGTVAGAGLAGVASNLRATTGLAPLEEAARQFARTAITRGENYRY